MPVPKVYAKQGQDAIASYSYTDISDGTGVVSFQGFNSKISGTTFYSLTTNTIYSHDICDDGVGATTTWTFNLSPFNTPKIVRGKAIVRFTGGCSANKSVYYKVQLSKVDSDSVATEMGSVYTITHSPGGAVVFKNFVNIISLTTTHFRRGDALRLTITSYTNGGAGLCYDPANRDGVMLATNVVASATPTKLECLVPFKLDL